MKLLETFIPYLTIGVVLTSLMLSLFGPDRAQAFVVTYTIGYAAVMVFLSGTE